MSSLAIHLDQKKKQFNIHLRKKHNDFVWLLTQAAATWPLLGLFLGTMGDPAADSDVVGLGSFCTIGEVGDGNEKAEPAASFILR